MNSMKFKNNGVLFDLFSNRSVDVMNILRPYENNLKKQDSYYRDDQLELVTFLTIVERESLDFFGLGSTVKRQYNKTDDMWNLVFSNKNLTKKELLNCLTNFKKSYWNEHGIDFFSKVFLSVE